MLGIIESVSIDQRIFILTNLAPNPLHKVLMVIPLLEKVVKFEIASKEAGYL